MKKFCRKQVYYVFNNLLLCYKICCFNFIRRVKFKNGNLNYFASFYLLYKRFRCLFLRCNFYIAPFSLCVVHFIKASDGRSNKNLSFGQFLKEFLLSISCWNALFKNINNHSSVNSFLPLIYHFKKYTYVKKFI